MDLALRDDRLAVLAQQGRCFPRCWIDARVHCTRANCSVVTGRPKRWRSDPSGAFSLDKVGIMRLSGRCACLGHHPGRAGTVGGLSTPDKETTTVQQPSCIPSTPQLCGGTGPAECCCPCAHSCDPAGTTSSEGDR